MSETPQTSDRRTRRGKSDVGVASTPTSAQTETDAAKLTPAQYEETGREDLPAQYEF